MYLPQLDTKIVRRVNTPDGEFVLHTNGSIKLPTGEGKDLNDLLDDPIMVDHQPGNVFQVIGDVLYVACLKRDAHVVEDMLDSDDGEPAYHSQAYLLAVDWRNWSRVWDRDLCLGGLTALAVSDHDIYAAGFRERYEDDRVDTVIAKLTHAGELTWLQTLEAGTTPHPTEIDLRFEHLLVYVDSFNDFQGRVLRFKVDLTPEGHITNLTTL